MQPATEWLEGSGLTIDTCLAAPGIVACGDVARWPNLRYGEFCRVEHWDDAVRMAVHAARRLRAIEGDPEATLPFTPCRGLVGSIWRKVSTGWLAVRS